MRSEFLPVRVGSLVIAFGGLGVVREVELQQVKPTWFDDWSTGWAYRGVIEKVVSF